MTSEERKEAERLAKRYAKQFGVGKNFGRPFDTLPNYAKADFIAGYAAACEAKQAEIAALMLAVTNKFKDDVFTSLLDTERARSAKLIEALRYLAGCSGDVDDVNMTARDAIAEYEAGRD